MTASANDAAHLAGCGKSADLALADIEQRVII